MRESSNPAFRSLTQTVARGRAGAHQYGQSQYGPGGYGQGYGQDQYQQAFYADGQYGAPQQMHDARPMTVDDVVSKTGITLAVIVALAAVNYFITAMVSTGLGLILTVVGAIGGLITVLVSTSARSTAPQW